jgi:hypothetical protein
MLERGHNADNQNPDSGRPARPPSPAGRASWAELLESTISAMRDVRTLELELMARSAVLTEALDELIGRIVDEHALDVVLEIRPLAELLAERDPVDAGLLRERHP